jgi:osmotically-inducible protein OsmY
MPTFAESTEVRSASPNAGGAGARTDIHQAVQSQLQRSPYRALRFVAFHIHEGTAVLTGKVPSYFLKQMAQHLVGQTQGVSRVRNELSVA